MGQFKNAGKSIGKVIKHSQRTSFTFSSNGSRVSYTENLLTLLPLCPREEASTITFELGSGVVKQE